MTNNPPEFTRFVTFVKQCIGGDHLDIADFFNSEISAMAKACRIDWDRSKDNINYDDKKNKHPQVIGLETADKGRVYIWAKIKTFEKLGDTFTYPVISFKSKQNTYGQPGEYFNPLGLLFDKYDQHKLTGTRPPSIKPESDQAKEARTRQQVILRQQTEQADQQQVLIESRLYQAMGGLHQPKLFSIYLKDKQVHDVGKKFDIRIGKNQYGFFTCFALYNYQGDFGGLQRIYHKKPKGWGSAKSTSKGFNPMGHFAMFGGDLASAETIYICEGLATGLAMHKATGRPVVVCLMADNIAPVSGIIATHWPNIKRVHVADNDQGKPHYGNTGVYQCAVAVQQHGGWVFVPQPSSGNDANDVLVYDGLAALKQQVYDCRQNYLNLKFAHKVTGMFNYI